MCKPKGNGGMGFKNIQAFTMAMLAKKSWRNLFDKSTLLHQIYKEKYFPDCEFVEAKLGHALSYTWCGITEAMHVVDERGASVESGGRKEVNL